MNPIEQQQKVISELCKLVHASAANGYTEAACRFRYFKEDDGSESVDCEFWYFMGGKRVSAHLAYDREVRPIRLVPRLHEMMRMHTGGNWTAFTLTIDENGKAKAHFEYPES